MQYNNIDICSCNIKQQDMSNMAQPPAQPRESGALPPPGSEYHIFILLRPFY